MSALTPKTISPQEYLTFLNKVYPGWGDQSMYDWAFRKLEDSDEADIFVLCDENQNIVGGSAITYRTLGEDRIQPAKIGIMTGSWTLPEHRGKGCFSEAIRYSMEKAKKRDCWALTAFVKNTNASSRRLAAAGAEMYPAYYIFAQREKNWEPPFRTYSDCVRIIEADDAHIEYLYKKHRNNARDLRFTYTPSDFRKQYFARPDKTLVLLVMGETVVVEETHDTIKVLLTSNDYHARTGRIMTMLRNWVWTDKKKHLYYYTTVEMESAVLAHAGFTVTPGAFAYLPLPEHYALNLKSIHPEFTMGDKM